MRDKSSYFLFIGPALFLLSLILLLCKVGFLLARPVWIASFTLSLALSSWIAFLTVREWWMCEKQLRKERDEKGKNALSLQERLEEVQRLYLAKVQRLENELIQKEEAIEQESLKQAKMERDYQLLLDESLGQKNETGALITSLEEALDELRHLRQLVFTWEEKQKTVPLNIIHKYEQLLEQFGEKTSRLDRVKKDLFGIEGKLLLLEKEQEEEHLEEKFTLEEAEVLVGGLLEEREQLLQEVTSLEQLVSMPKRASSPKPKKKIEKMVEMDLLASSVDDS